MTDLVAWQARARRYLHRKGVPPQEHDDLIQEMLLDVLEHPDREVSLSLTYLGAWDRLDPRRRAGADGVRHRQASRLWSLETPLLGRDDLTLGATLAAPQAQEDVLASRWLAQQLAGLETRTATIVHTYFWEGQTMQTIAEQWRITPGYVSQLITQALLWLRLCSRLRDTGQAAGLPDWPDLCWEVQWL